MWKEELDGENEPVRSNSCGAIAGRCSVLAQKPKVLTPRHMRLPTPRHQSYDRMRAWHDTALNWDKRRPRLCEWTLLDSRSRGGERAERGSSHDPR